MEKELDKKTKSILEVLRKYPDGISVNKLYEKLKDDKGRYLMSKPTFQKRLEMLKSKGIVIVEGEEEWDRGKKKIIKLRDAGKLIADKLSEIRSYGRAFDKFLESRVSKLKEKKLESFEELIILNEIELVKSYISHKLNSLRREIISSDFSKDLKKDLIFETFETEKEIENIFIDKIERIKPFYDLYRAYLKSLQECIEEIKENPKEANKIFEKTFEKNLLEINEKLYRILKQKQEEERKREEEFTGRRYTEEDLEELIRMIEENPEEVAERFGEFLKDLIILAFRIEEVERLTEELAISLDPYSSFKMLRHFKSRIESEIEKLIEEAKRGD